MTVEVLRPAELTPDLLGAWREFQSADPDLGSAFLTPEWAQAVERAQGTDAVRIAVARHEGRAAAFLAVRPGRFTAVAAGAPLSDYQAVIAPPGAAVDLQAMLKALGVARFDFTHAPLSQAALATGVRGRQTSFCVDVGSGWPAYVAELRARKSNLVKDVGNRRRRLEREFGEVVFTPVSHSVEDFDRMLGFKRQQYRDTGQTDVLGRDWSRRLLHDLRATQGERFGGLFSTLHVGGELAAGHFGLYADGVLSAWFIAHQCDFARHSPGLLVLSEVVRHLAESGDWREVDLGVGDLPFKRRIANRGRELGYGFIGRPSPASAFRGAAYWMRERAEAAPLGRLSYIPGKAMRRWDLIRTLG
jgi:CelD/BcsL family acetyltransferase involved in cellulose biosynthesis